MEDNIETIDPQKAKKAEEKAEQKEADNMEKLKARNWDQEKKIKILEAQLEAAKAEKRKPGITAVEDDGTPAKRKRPNSNPWGLTDLILPPFLKGRVATYRLCGMENINPATGQPVAKVPGLIPGEYILYDRFEKDVSKRNKFVRNIIGQKTVIKNGVASVEDDIDDIEFDRGYLHVNIERKYLLYCFMELNPLNVSNRHRPTNSMPGFERLDVNVRSKAYEGAIFDLGIDAVNEIKKMKNEDVLAYAASVSSIDTLSKRAPSDIKRDLMVWAQQAPEQYFRLNKNSKEAVRLNMLDALAFGLVSYDINKRCFILEETEEKICEHTVSQDPNQELIRFLSSEEGADWYKAIMQRMNYWED